jgi:hypothetical protein
MSDPQRRVIEQAIAEARHQTVKQLSIGVIFGVGLPVVFGFTTAVIIATCLNALTGVLMLRRWARLRPTAPAIVALLDRPENIVEIRGMPDKLPPGKLPMMLVVRAHDGLCSLFPDKKQPHATIELVRALRVRSPNAIVSVANVPLEAAAS